MLRQRNFAGDTNIGSIEYIDLTLPQYDEPLQRANRRDARNIGIHANVALLDVAATEVVPIASTSREALAGKVILNQHKN